MSEQTKTFKITERAAFDAAWDAYHGDSRESLAVKTVAWNGMHGHLWMAARNSRAVEDDFEQNNKVDHAIYLWAANYGVPLSNGAYRDLVKIAASGPTSKLNPVARMERFPKDQSASKILGSLRPAWLSSMPAEGTLLYSLESVATGAA